MHRGSFKILRLLGVDVLVHWTWFLLGALVVSQLTMFSTLGWRVLVFVSIFVIAALHEFGHVFACRSVRGEASTILLSPMGGAAVMNPPDRPGAVFWSVAAGPLVNVLLLPVTAVAYLLVRGELDWPAVDNDVQLYWFSVLAVNAGLLVCNLVPIFPLDGGQLLMSAIWFVVGRARALRIVVWTGPCAAAGLAVYAVVTAQPILLLISAFFALHAYKGYCVAKAMGRMDSQKMDEHLDPHGAD